VWPILRSDSGAHQAERLVEAIDQEVGIIPGQAHRRLDAEHVAEQASLAEQRSALATNLPNVRRSGKERWPTWEDLRIMLTSSAKLIT